MLPIPSCAKLLSEAAATAAAAVAAAPCSVSTFSPMCSHSQSTTLLEVAIRERWMEEETIASQERQLFLIQRKKYRVTCLAS